MKNRSVSKLVCFGLRFFSLVVMFQLAISAAAIDNVEKQKRDSILARGMVERLGSGQFEQTIDAAGTLLHLGKLALPALQKAVVESTNKEVRTRAAHVLDRIAQYDQKRPMVPKLEMDSRRPTFEKKGKILGSEHWAANCTYRIAGDISIMPGAVLRIDPGAVVLLSNHANIEVEERGGLELGSMDGDPVILTSAAESEGK